MAGDGETCEAPSAGKGRSEACGAAERLYSDMACRLYVTCRGCHGGCRCGKRLSLLAMEHEFYAEPVRQIVVLRSAKRHLEWIELYFVDALHNYFND